ncbi:MAG: malate:quinone oxidoreductase [Sulfurimonas sp. RIFCSPHIGHO2_12_FULL_36_9]|uniref:FAD-dependent oxidoreductase n=1 Tax=Sulfurimonas sp. RIFCSPLOWO2_12_36_12 TaxID=1802253 RepID=UPI0008B5426B|nr:FAD-dependent oxidoreductase [Sulfurimonas sp. RIFCSPLOWO2_12_36_12]OHD97317.1 MAG: malate:quinone oxidoreductase [Sulfurimonas sp. RIFCSPHIGHO2_12_FULL_36_9]OHD97543.1 MAG: malate:quinone oxidoreductase [Sulfurimonas sp. RIFCSPLOWO2_02_FULL_36_28]OHE00468.1 MAG: malate:quinone oxidoreductase [Sulfurimonas sp. RIFCSPLOWO2_12_36_12]
MAAKNFEVIIVGAGVSGTALAYELARYTDIKSIGIIEKYEDVATLNSCGTSNSQTVHVGDIETNYTLQKAAITKRTAKMVEKYCLNHHYQNEIIFSHQKMALGVGKKEVEFLLHRYEEFSELFPYLEVWNKEKLKELEPRVVFDENGNERKEDIVAIGATGQWTTVDYGKLAKSFLENAKKEQDVKLELFLNTKVEEIKKSKKRGYMVKTKNETFYADFVVVDAGAHSLFLAHKMGFGLNLGCLPVAGSFYMTNERMLNGKVYMIQNPKLPFAALHGDPDVLANGNTRFGPTALVLPKLERYKNGTYMDFWKTLRFDKHIAIALWKLLKESDIRNYIFRNFLFEIPFINKYLFLKDARKIVPSLKADEFRYAKGFGGVRPQVLNKDEQKLLLGEASIYTGEGVIFNMTPSPGATSCLGNAERDLRYIVKYLGKNFNEEKFNDELTDGEYCVLPEPIASQKAVVNLIRAEIQRTEEKYLQELHVGKPDADFWDKPHSKI